MGKDGLMSMTTEAVVNVKAVQKSLNQMSRDERIEFIRASGDPKSVRRDHRARRRRAGRAAAALAGGREHPQGADQGVRLPHLVGRRRAARTTRAPDFAVLGEAQDQEAVAAARRRRASTVTKYALTSWTVKCIDRATGEEIYYNTALPKGMGSWPSEEEALQAIGAKIADEFSRDFFLQHVERARARRSRSPSTACPMPPPRTSSRASSSDCPACHRRHCAARRRSRASTSCSSRAAAPPADLVANGVLKPLNAQLGQACFSLGAIAGDKVAVVFDKRCADAAVLSRLETNPPAGLYGAPPRRQKAVIRNPEMLKKLAI